MTPRDVLQRFVSSKKFKGDKVFDLTILDGPWHNEAMSIIYFEHLDGSRFRMEIKKVSP